MHIRIRKDKVLKWQQSETTIEVPKIRGELFAVAVFIKICFTLQISETNSTQNIPIIRYILGAFIP